MRGDLIRETIANLGKAAVQFQSTKGFGTLSSDLISNAMVNASQSILNWDIDAVRLDSNP